MPVRAETTAPKAGEARSPGSVTTSGLRIPVSSRHAGIRRTAARPKTILVGNENDVISSNISGLCLAREHHLADPVTELQLTNLVGQHIVVDIKLPAQVLAIRIAIERFQFFY